MENPSNPTSNQSNLSQCPPPLTSVLTPTPVRDPYHRKTQSEFQFDLPEDLPEDLVFSESFGGVDELGSQDELFNLDIENLGSGSGADNASSPPFSDGNGLSDPGTAAPAESIPDSDPRFSISKLKRSSWDPSSSTPLNDSPKSRSSGADLGEEELASALGLRLKEENTSYRPNPSTNHELMHQAASNFPAQSHSYSEVIHEDPLGGLQGLDISSYGRGSNFGRSDIETENSSTM